MFNFSISRMQSVLIAVNAPKLSHYNYNAITPIILSLRSTTSNELLVGEKVNQITDGKLNY